LNPTHFNCFAAVSEDTVLAWLAGLVVGWCILVVLVRRHHAECERETKPESAGPSSIPFEWLGPALLSLARRFGFARAVVLAALAAFVASVVFAPWLITTASTTYALKEKRLAEATVFAPLLSPPRNESGAALHTARIRFDLLVLEWTAIVAVTGGILFMGRSPKP